MRTSLLTAIVALSLIPAGRAESDPEAWTSLERGLDLGVFAAPNPSAIGDSLIRVVRIDPERFELRLLNASATEDKRTRTARAWCKRAGCVAAINSSMYRTDYLTSVSLMQTRTHVNNATLSKDNTILAFDRLRPGVLPVKMIDRECDDLSQSRKSYGTLVQSIRMISCKGRNVWAQQPKRWSTAAIGVDAEGNVLFIHVRSPFSTHDLIEILLALPLDLKRAMYAEGGPEAQLYVAAGGREEEFSGSYETGFNEDDDNQISWPVPNVIVAVRAGRS